MAKKAANPAPRQLSVVRVEYYQSTTDGLIRAVEYLSDGSAKMRRRSPVYAFPDTTRLIGYEWSEGFLLLPDQLRRLLELNIFKPTIKP